MFLVMLSLVIDIKEITCKSTQFIDRNTITNKNRQSTSVLAQSNTFADQLSSVTKTNNC